MVTEYLSAAKLGFDTIRAALGMVRDAKDALPNTEQRKAIEIAIDQSEKQLAIAEAQMAQALGYELCKCKFPPTIMLAVGSIADHKARSNKTVFECPECGYDTANPYSFDRTKILPNTRHP